MARYLFTRETNLNILREYGIDKSQGLAKIPDELAQILPKNVQTYTEDEIMQMNSFELLNRSINREGEIR